MPARFAGMALLLVVLILLTPVLVSSGPPVAGSLLTQAELIIDRVPGANTSHFYLRGLGTTVRYTAMSIEVAGGFNWTGAFPSDGLVWTDGSNGTNILTVDWATSENPVALNVSAYYQAAGASALYVGVVAFEFTNPSGSSAGTLYSVTSTPGLTVSGPTSVTDLPLTLLLVNVGSGP